MASQAPAKPRVPFILIRVLGSHAAHVLRWMFCAGIFVVYSNALQESANSILYNGLIEELVDVLQITDKQLVVRINFVPYFLNDNVPPVILQSGHSKRVL